MIVGTAVYEEALPDLPIATGDLYAPLPEFGESDSAGVVLTPMCDLAQGKVAWVKLAQAIPFKNYLERSLIPQGLKSRNQYRALAEAELMALGQAYVNQPAQRETLTTLSLVKEMMSFMKNIDPKKSAHYYLPGKEDPTQGYLVSFSFILSVPCERLQNSVPTLRLKSPWREQLLSRYVSYSSRVGTPDYSDESICRAIRAFFPELSEEQIRGKMK